MPDFYPNYRIFSQLDTIKILQKSLIQEKNIFVQEIIALSFLSFVLGY